MMDIFFPTAKESFMFLWGVLCCYVVLKWK